MRAIRSEMSRLVTKRTISVKGMRVAVKWQTTIAKGTSEIHVVAGFVATAEWSNGINSYAVEVADKDGTKIYVESLFEPQVNISVNVHKTTSPPSGELEADQTSAS